MNYFNRYLDKLIYIIVTSVTLSRMKTIITTTTFSMTNLLLILLLYPFSYHIDYLFVFEEPLPALLITATIRNPYLDL